MNASNITIIAQQREWYSNSTHSENQNAINHNTMAGPPRKRARRDEKPEAELPQKKYYRQRAHANPFSDHDLK